jgi:hypothetical protein
MDKLRRYFIKNSYQFQLITLLTLISNPNQSKFKCKIIKKKLPLESRVLLVEGSAAADEA